MTGERNSQAPIVPAHVEETVAKIAEVHAEHFRRAATVQRLARATTASIARPRTLAVFTLAIAGWVVLNLLVPTYGRAAPDPYPFPALGTVVAIAALYVTTMVLIAQLHDDELATRREQLMLELAIIAEQKSAKIIALLEEFRRNDPHQGNHRDEVAEAFAEPADPHAVLSAIEAAHDKAASRPVREKTKRSG